MAISEMRWTHRRILEGCIWHVVWAAPVSRSLPQLHQSSARREALNAQELSLSSLCKCPAHRKKNCRCTGWIRVPMSSDQAPHGPAQSHSLVWTK